MKRGDIVTVVLPGAYGKPRRALVVQGDDLSGSESVLVCPLTSNLDFRAPHRLELDADRNTGLHVPSLVMIDKVQAAPRGNCGPAIGQISPEQQGFIDAGLMFALGLSA